MGSQSIEQSPRTSSWIWVASSRVGAKIKVRTPLEGLDHIQRYAGTRKPNVLPEPVLYRNRGNPTETHGEMLGIGYMGIMLILSNLWLFYVVLVSFLLIMLGLFSDVS